MCARMSKCQSNTPIITRAGEFEEFGKLIWEALRLGGLLIIPEACVKKLMS